MRKVEKFDVYCAVCGILLPRKFSTRALENRPNGMSCSNECTQELKRRGMKTHFSKLDPEERKQKYGRSGAANGNYKNSWSSEQRERHSRTHLALVKARPELRYEYGKANRGRKFSAESRERMSKSREGEKNHFFGKEHPPESKRLIGIKSSAKFTNEYKERVRLTNIARGVWIDHSDNEFKGYYYQAADWTKDVLNYIKVDWDLVNSVGFFGKNHPNGFVRDHIYARLDGYRNGVFPLILKHPCNLQLLTRIDNSKKYFKHIKTNGSSISLDELFNRIINYEGDWPLHNDTLLRITEYQQGIRNDMKALIIAMNSYNRD